MSAALVDTDTGEIVSTDLALPDVAALELANDPAQQIVLACERANAWLQSGIAVPIEQIVDTQAQAAAIATFAVQMQLGKDAELKALEVQRRAERGKGLAIRRGQEAGEIARLGDQPGTRAPYTRIRNGREEHIQPAVRDAKTDLRSPKEFLANGTDSVMTYAVTDDVTDEQFDAAIDAAKAEGNLSRANVVRKVRGQQSKVPVAQQLDRIEELASQGYHSSQIAVELNTTAENIRRLAKKAGIAIQADKVLRGAKHRIDHTRFARETVASLQNAAESLRLLDYSQIDVAEAVEQEWATTLTDSLRALNRFSKQIKEMTHVHDED